MGHLPAASNRVMIGLRQEQSGRARWLGVVARMVLQ
jgi:hypothetical protein